MKDSISKIKCKERIDCQSCPLTFRLSQGMHMNTHHHSHCCLHNYQYHRHHYHHGHQLQQLLLVKGQLLYHRVNWVRQWGVVLPIGVSEGSSWQESALERQIGIRWGLPLMASWLEKRRDVKHTCVNMEWMKQRQAPAFYFFFLLTLFTSLNTNFYDVRRKLLHSHKLLFC